MRLLRLLFGGHDERERLFGGLDLALFHFFRRSGGLGLGPAIRIFLNIENNPIRIHPTRSLRTAPVPLRGKTPLRTDLSLALDVKINWIRFNWMRRQITWLLRRWLRRVRCPRPSHQVGRRRGSGTVRRLREKQIKKILAIRNRFHFHKMRSIQRFEKNGR